MTQISLPWPPASLSPNARGHWSKKAKAAKRYRGDCRILCMASGLRQIKRDTLELSITFNPPDRRHRDLDNMLASLKSGLDGIADATGVDDSRWTITMTKGEPRRGGAVVVKIK